MMICGIDPGLEGAFAIRDRDSIIFEVMPRRADGQLDLQDLNRLLRDYADHITHAYLEQAGMRPKQSTQSGFNFGRNFGCVESMLVCLGIKFTIIQPKAWSEKYPHGVTEKHPSKRMGLIKKQRAIIAQRLYPGISLLENEKCRTPHQGIVDALLIADYGWRLRMGGAQ